MKMPDIQKTIDDYTKFHAEMYAKHVFDEMIQYIPKSKQNLIQTLTYEDWKTSDCCGSSCGCETDDEMECEQGICDHESCDTINDKQLNIAVDSFKKIAGDNDVHKDTLIKEYMYTKGGDFQKWWQGLSQDDKLIITREFFD